MKKMKLIYASAAVLGSSFLASAAHAALDTGITTAMDGAKADGIELAQLALLVIIAIAAFKYIRRAI